MPMRFSPSFVVRMFAASGVSLCVSLMVPTSAQADQPAAPVEEQPQPSEAAAAPALPEVPAGSPSGPPVPTARARVLVLPVVLGNAPDPDPLLVTSLVKGLSENPNWDVVSPASGDPLEALPLSTVSAELVAQADAALTDTADARATNDHAAVVAALGPVMEKLVAATSEAPLGAGGAAAVMKLGSALLAAQAGAGLEQEASATALTLKQLLPGRALGQAEGFSLVAAALLQATPAAGAAVQLTSNPKGCDVMVDGAKLGPAPVSLIVRPHTKYSASAVCTQGAGKRESFVRTIVAEAPVSELEPSATKPATVTFVLDATLPYVLERNAQGARLRFANAEQRRGLEEVYVPRLAERFGVTSVVLVSSGQFQSNDWLNARLYLSSGFKNRHGLARMESARAAALGRYLSTGRESPGVLNAEEAGNMVAASQTLRPLTGQKLERSPWYSDVPGWSMLGSGAVAVALGMWATGKADDKRTDAELNTRGDPIRRDKLNSQANNLKFWGSVGVYGGAALAGAGVFLLLLPEYEETRGELYGLTPLPGGAAFNYSGRF